MDSTLNTMRRLARGFGAVGVAALVWSCGALAQTAVVSKPVMQKIDVAAAGDDVTLRMSFTSPLKAAPTGFSLASPARISLDFPNVEAQPGIADGASARGMLRDVKVAQTETRMRMVLSLEKAANYETRLDGNDLIVTLRAAVPVNVLDRRADSEFVQAKSLVKTSAIKDIAFRRGVGGEARVLIDLEDPATSVDVRKQGNVLQLEFANVSVADTLLRKLDVTDFGTPVIGVTTTRQGSTVRVQIQPKTSSQWEHIAYQTDNQFVAEVREILEDTTLLGGGVGRYTGERMSLRFREYPIREVLQAFSDFSNLNIVISDAVSGTITLNLQDVPWDQAMDVILQQKNLQMDKRGNVVTIAPKEEILARRRALSELVTFDPTRDVVIQLGYIGAAAAKKRIEEYLKNDPTRESQTRTQGARPGAFEAGAFERETKTSSNVTLRVTVDEQTNKIFIRASEATIQAVRNLLKEIDVPPRQVLIEARIVEAAEGFSRNLGARIGFTGTQSTSRADAQVAGGSNLALPVGTAAPGALQFYLANPAATRTLSLELAAAERDGKSRLISSPKVLTGNGNEAKISDGRKVPYKTVSAEGTKTEFQDATLDLTIKPNINADGRVALEIKVNKGSLGELTSDGYILLKKLVETQVVVENGGTVVIGGIYTEETRAGVDKVPFLGDLPLIGWLFREETKGTERAETLIFITPRVIGDDLAVR